MNLDGWLRRSFDRIRGADPPRVVVRPVFGLANRLRAVTSAQAIARCHGLGFAVRWEPGEYFSDAGWRELFANEFDLISRGEYEGALASGQPVLSHWLERVPGAGVRPLSGFDPQRSLAAIRRRGLVYDFGYQNLDRSLRAHGVPGMRRCKRERLRCCRELRAAEPIARRVDDYVARHIAGRNVVGVHIRRGDAARNPFGRRCLESPDEVFVREIEQLAVADPEIRFFLATDCPKTQEEFVARFRGRILTYDKIFVESNYGAAKAGQADAVTEMFLLSRTRMVIGTRASTFGRMAAAIGGLEYRAPVRPGSDPESGFSV